MSVMTLVEDLILRSGASKAELSRRSGVSRSSLDEYVHGTSQPSLAQLERLGQAVGLRLDVSWSAASHRNDPSWLIASNPDMADRATTTAERAKLLERVIPLGRELRRRPPSADLEFPPFRTLRP